MSFIPPVARPLARAPSRSPSPPRPQQQRQPRPQARGRGPQESSPQRPQSPHRQQAAPLGRGGWQQVASRPSGSPPAAISGGGWRNAANANNEPPQGGHEVLRLRGGAPSIETFRRHVRAAQRDYDQAVRMTNKAKQKYDNLNANKGSSRNEQAIAAAKADWDYQKDRAQELKTVLDDLKQSLATALTASDRVEE